ncbi:protein asteroid homolog 1 [Dryobates pubescens]|uniref:protein asteroid homolog 1 n=1 Tax=Dryobates pubescens TaxID=118200 RepID=UPI0023B8E5D6|nr:protein asteroid homolog 1 [Dryobates pubescens]
MGVWGLKSFVEERGSFFTELRVSDTKLVVDGSSLYYYLCFASASDLRRGGDYGPFAAAVSEFFGSLRRCRISPFVVLDGGRDLSDRKLPVLRERAADRLRKACSLSQGGGGQVAPLLTREAFVQELRRLAVPFVQCFAEADREIAGLASRWGCPVLSLDSDFCVFDLPGGYCPLNHFQWQSVGAAEEPRGCYVPARRFSVERFCKHFAPLDKSLLPLFAVMSGNDYVCLGGLEAFYSRARLARGGAAGGGARHGRLRALLRWLAQFPRPAQAVDGVLEHLKARRREEVRELLCAAMDDYTPSEVKLEDFFESGRYECAAAGSAGVPQWVLSALARGRLDPFVSNVLLLRSIFLRVQVENMRRPSAHGAALPIRRVIYGLLLRQPRGGPAAPPGGHSAQPPVVCEFGRLHKTIQKTNVRAASLPTEPCGDPFPLDKLTEVPLSCRQALLLGTLGVQMSSLAAVPSHLQLPAAVTCHWLRCSEPPVRSHQLKALLLMMVSGELHRTATRAGPPVSPAEDDSVAYNQFVKWKEKKLPREEFDLDAAHSFCQWQCCLQMGLYLNQLLSAPLAEPDLSRLYSGTLVHRLCQELKSAASVENLFSVSQRLTGLYQLLLRTVEAAVAPDFFQKMATATAGSCRKKKASGKKQKPPRCAVPGAQQLCSGNRFASLQGED